MDTQQFCYWLQGFFELSETNALSTRQTQIIKDHLALLFKKITPDHNERFFPLTKIPLTTTHSGRTADRLCGMQKEPTYCTPKSADDARLYRNIMNEKILAADQNINIEQQRKF